MIPSRQPTACILCSINCGIEVEVAERDGALHFESIRGHREHPTSQGYLCQKASRLDYYQNHAGRLKHPLRRRGDGSFEQIDWDTAIREVATRLSAIRKNHGGHAIAYYGGGGQGNHLGGAYAVPFRAALGTPYLYNSLAQEKTGDFWVNGRLFGRQTCHVTEGIEESDYVIIFGANPWQSHGLPRARQVIREIGKDPERTLVVVDPRRTETAEHADIHLQVKPGADALLMTAMLAVIVQEGLEDRDFLNARTTGHAELFATLAEVPIDEYIARAGLDAGLVRTITRDFANAESACTRHDLGVEHSLHSTLNTYLEKLLSLVTGNFGREGGNNLHTQLVPLIGHSKEPDAGGSTTRVTGMREISKLFPPNILPAEIDTDHPERVRALVVDSSNPMQTAADTAAYRKAFEKLELLVAIDVADTETVRLADYVLPAPTQYEKWEATFFTLSFPTNYFHLRRPILEPAGDTLPEPEIYRRLMVAMGDLPAGFPILAAIAKLDRRMPSLGLFPKAFALTLALRPRLKEVASMVLYATLGPALTPPRPKPTAGSTSSTTTDNAAAAAVVWGSCQFFARRFAKQVRRAGYPGDGSALAESLFRAILESDTAVPISTHTYDEMWELVRHADGRVHLAVPELLEELGALRVESESEHLSARFPFVLASGERRSYNANQIYRDPEWRRQDREGALRIHPDDVERLGLAAGQLVVCESRTGSVEAMIQPDDSVRPGCLSLPHGYGQSSGGQEGRGETGAQDGPRINMLTNADHCDPLAKTPYHKYVPVRLIPITTDGLRAT